MKFSEWWPQYKAERWPNGISEDEELRHSITALEAAQWQLNQDMKSITGTEYKEEEANVTQ